MSERETGLDILNKEDRKIGTIKTSQGKFQVIVPMKFLSLELSNGSYPGSLW